MITKISGTLIVSSATRYCMCSSKIFWCIPSKRVEGIPIKISEINKYILTTREEYKALQFIPAPTSPWLVRKHFLLANKSMLLAKLITIQIRTTMYSQTCL